jgi:hypothetical protein
MAMNNCEKSGNGDTFAYTLGESQIYTALKYLRRKIAL